MGLTSIGYNQPMLWIYLSPHFDDVALSCGGLVWEQARAGDVVSIWTVCGGDPPVGELSPFAQELHNRWVFDHDAPTQRRLEDFTSCRRLGAGQRYFAIPDCIYRRHPESGEYMYASEQSLSGPLHIGDTVIIRDLQREILNSLPHGATLACPLALGNHVDHQLTRQAAEGLGCELWYYADYPYVMRNPSLLDNLQRDGWTNRTFPVSPDGLEAWQDAIAAHASQVSTFWPDTQAMRRAVADSLSFAGGIRLWKKPTG